MAPKIFIANRGEVALRIIHAVHELGMRAVLLVGPHDEEGLPARLADEKIILEGTSLAETYLNGKRIIQLAKEAKCELLHPGFGFLSEDEGFARAVSQSGISWIGPSPEAMASVSDKYSAKKVAQSLGIPTSPWVVLAEEGSKKDLQKISTEIGFPCLVKAIAGGGGKGLKRVDEEKDLAGAIASARREAKNAFGNEKVLVEKLISHARHVEIQVFGDRDGQVHVFGERDCSVQRRYQKIIEESPAPHFTEENRSELEEYARKLASRIHYQNAGTVEFLVEAKTLKPYFMEMNTRLQVEHGVTEERYGIDLVKMQIVTALGQPISAWLPQGKPRGHVMELRLYAEDSQMNFLPQPGKVHFLEFPVMKGLRLEKAMVSGETISGAYDPMIAKLIISATNRQEALEKSIYALRHTKIVGPTTNRDFLVSVLQDPLFQKGGVTTHFLDDGFAKASGPSEQQDRTLALAIAKVLMSAPRKSNSSGEGLDSLFSRLPYGRQDL